MTNRDRILKAVEYIEANLYSEIELSDIAKVSCCSLYHFIRLFQSIVGVSPKKYLIQRRLTESATQLKESDRKIVTIAFDLQFGSHEVFTRAFQRQFATTPSKFRAGALIPNHLLTKAITEDYIYQSKKARTQEPEIMTLEEHMVVGFSYFIRGDLKDLNLSGEWKDFMSNVQQIKNKVQPEKYYQIQSWSEQQEIEGMHFFIGIEVDSIINLDPKFVVKIIPKGMYLKFIHQGLSRNVGFTYQYIYNEYLPNSEYKLPLPFNFEYYGDNYLSPDKEKSESYLLIPVEL